MTILESLLAVFGIRGPLEESAYSVTRTLDRGVEIRVYASRAAVETGMSRGGDSDAFRRLFAYISGGNGRGERIAMTVPVEAAGQRLAMTVPVERDAAKMRFFLPAALAADPPTPTDPKVSLTTVPEQHLAVLRFSGRATDTARAKQMARLVKVLADAGIATEGAPFFMGYDPPFTIPFLRRDEVAIRVPTG
ncbi:SOUL family heme-binding protein [Methylobacterium haplocladii]|uniref:SOUL heme-binding protein n=1 Tax=Methylobacterium haplocladii TaxID=1176176 RepID=A0A512IK86_9HYPH|nr:heme-binding protein [Methylobacterium haplocladii]GEO98101.1 SOUL heme-binding protein [Methylobacterium haplocladii]GLS59048.1 SOUL heme-binding protein [Methylobacterium haplocladii]